MHRLYSSCRSLIYNERFYRWKCPVRRHVAIGRRDYLDKRTFLGPRVCLHTTPLSLNTRREVLKCGTEVQNEGKTLRITWNGGLTATYSAVWLRHNCQCAACVTSSNQKAVDPAAMDPTMTVTPRHLSGKSGLPSIFRGRVGVRDQRKIKGISRALIIDYIVLNAYALMANVGMALF